MAQDSLGLQLGDYILYQDEEIREEDGLPFVAPGMVGKVLSAHPRMKRCTRPSRRCLGSPWPDVP